jgi:Spy/CpxP family protein refolding chaperone
MSRNRSLHSTLLALALLAGLGLAAAATAKPGHGPDGPGSGPRMLERKLEGLELPADTRAKIEALFAAARPSQDALREQIRGARQSLDALLGQDAVDEAAVMAQADALGALMTERRKQELATLIQVRGLLTPEQREKLTQQMREHRGRGWHARGHGEHGEGGCEHGAEKPPAAPGDVQS